MLQNHVLQTVLQSVLQTVLQNGIFSEIIVIFVCINILIEANSKILDLFG